MGILRAASRGLILPGQKPRGPVRIDAMHPLANGLNTYIITGLRQGAEVDLVSGLELSWTPSTGIPATAGMTELGPSLNFDDAAANRLAVTNANLQLTKTSIAGGTGDYTIAGLVRVNALTIGQYNPMFGQEDTPTGNTAAEIYVSSDSKIHFYSNPDSVISVTPVVGAVYSVIGVRIGTTLNFYLNGVAATSGTTANTVTTATQIFLGGFNSYAGGQPHFDLLWCGGWNRALSADEALLLYADPYGLLIPAEGEMPALFTAAAATTTIYQLMNVG